MSPPNPNLAIFIPFSSFLRAALDDQRPEAPSPPGMRGRFPLDARRRGPAGHRPRDLALAKLVAWGPFTPVLCVQRLAFSFILSLPVEPSGDPSSGTNSLILAPPRVPRSLPSYLGPRPTHNSPSPVIWLKERGVFSVTPGGSSPLARSASSMRWRR